MVRLGWTWGLARFAAKNRATLCFFHGHGGLSHILTVKVFQTLLVGACMRMVLVGLSYWAQSDDPSPHISGRAGQIKRHVRYAERLKMYVDSLHPRLSASPQDWKGIPV